VAGRTVPLTLPARRELGAVLMPPRRAHPWPERIASSRFGQLPGDLVDYTPTEPLLVVEVDTDVSFEHDRWRHPTRYCRVRSDLRPVDLTPLPDTSLPVPRRRYRISIAGQARTHRRGD
jgi:hypothetical protein